MNLNFHKVNEIDTYQFFQIPKALYTSKKYQNLLDGAKLMYGILLDRMKLSKKNKWADDKGNVFIIYPREDLADYVNVSTRTVSRYMDSLKECGLIFEKRQGLCRPNLIYVLKAYLDDGEFEQGKDNLSYTNETPESELNWTSITTPISNTNISNTENNNTGGNTKQDTDTEVDTTSKTVVIDNDNNNNIKELDKLFQEVSGKSNISLIRKLLRQYSYEQIQEKLIYMQKFKQRNTIYNPCGFLVQSLKDNYTFIDKAKAILEKANKAIAKTYQELEEYRNIKPASREVSLNWIESMKLQLGVV